MDGVKRGYRKYATFQGRASMREYWWFILFVSLTLLGLVMLGFIADALTGHGGDVFVTMGWLFYLGSLLPIIAVSIRRLHDTGRSGSPYLMGFNPFVGGIIIMVYLCGSTVPAAQRYGPPYLGPPPTMSYLDRPM